tara:strand:- start:65 stop:346 length:282 start_codon:yes stop_codon:yes gene_type:complete
MALDTKGKQYNNEHPKFNLFDKYKSKKANVMKVADISQKDIDLSKAKGFSTVDLETAKMLSGNPTLTQKELTQLKETAKNKEDIEPTGKFKKD